MRRQQRQRRGSARMPLLGLVLLGLTPLVCGFVTTLRPGGPVVPPQPRATAQFDQEAKPPLPPGPWQWPLAGNMLEVFRLGSVHLFERRVFKK